MSEQKSLYLQNCEIRKELGEDIKLFELQENSSWKKIQYPLIDDFVYINTMILNLKDEEFISKYEVIEYLEYICEVDGGIEKQKPLVYIEIYTFLRKIDGKRFYLVNCHRLFQLKIYNKTYDKNYFGAYYTSYFVNENCEEIDKLKKIYHVRRGLINEYFELFDITYCYYLYDTSNWDSAIIKMARFYPKSNEFLFSYDECSCACIFTEQLEKRFREECKNISIYKEYEYCHYCEESLSSKKIFSQNISFKIDTNESEFDIGVISKIFGMDKEEFDFCVHSKFLNMKILMTARRTIFEFNNLPFSPKVDSCLFIPDEIKININKYNDKKTFISYCFNLSEDRKFYLLNSMLHMLLTDQKILVDTDMVDIN